MTKKKSWLYRFLRYLFFPNRGVKPEIIESELGKQLVKKNQRLTVKRGGKK